MNKSNRKDGKLLEKVIEKICSGIEGAKVTHNAKVKGRQTGRDRQIDVLVEGKYGAFDIKIEIEAKDHKNPVEISTVESFVSKVKDTGVDLGVMVCPSGFDAGAKAVAEANNIQLYEIFTEELENTQLFIPIRLIMPDIGRFAARFQHKSYGHFSIPADLSKVRVILNDKEYDLKQLVVLAWNRRMFPQIAGDQVANFDAVKIIDVDNPEITQYCELSFDIEVIEKYYLKLFPANFLRSIQKESNHYFLGIPLYSDPAKMQEHWKEYSSLEAMNEAASISEQPNDIQDLIMRPGYSIDVDSVSFSD